MKDNFSDKSKQYKQFRPSYPDELFEFIFHKMAYFDNAWDCATGNGQIAVQLMHVFDKVYATDISEKQIEQAEKFPKIEYSVQSAEKTNFPDDFFDLIIVGQAIHWFEFDKFFLEVNRTAKNHALLVVTGYARLRIDPETDKIIDLFHDEVLENYWDKERKYIDEEYKTIPFPYEEIEPHHFENSYDWTLEHLLGYLETWSAVNHYIKQTGKSPVDLIKDQLKAHWPEGETKKVNFPVLLRIGKINKDHHF